MQSEQTKRGSSYFRVRMSNWYKLNIYEYTETMTHNNRDKKKIKKKSFVC